MPQLVSQSPIDVIDADNRRIQAQFSTAIDEALLSAETVRISREGEALTPADIRFSEENILSFELNDGLKPGSRYEVALDGRLAGPLRVIADGDFTWAFQTTVPQLVSQSPAGEISTIGDEIEAEFSTAIDEDVIREQDVVRITLQSEIQTVAEVDFDDETNVLSLALAEGFKPGALYEVTLDGRLAGPLRVIADGDFTWQFRTPIPELVGSTPNDEQRDVATAANAIAAVFDNPIDDEILLLQPGSVIVSTGGAEIDITGLDYNSDTRTARFAIADGLRAGTAYQLRIAAAIGGPRRQSDYTWDFHTAIPALTSVLPADKSVDIDIDIEEITVHFSAPIDSEQRTPANFTLLRQGQPIELRAGDPVDRGDNTYGLAPAEGFAVGTRYDAQIAAAVSGPLGPGQILSFSFITDVPALIGTTPTAGDSSIIDLNAEIEALFDAPVDQTVLLTDGNVVLLAGGEAMEIPTPAYDPTTNAVRFAPVDGLLPGTAYEVRIAPRVGGPLTLALGPDVYRWYFHTRVPAISAVTPTDGSDVSAGPRRLTVEFTGPVNPALVNSRNFALSRSGRTLELHNDEFDYDATTFTVSYPTIDLRSGTAYEAAASSRVSGPLASVIRLPDRNWSFTTEVPRVAATLPIDGEDGVSTAEPSLQIAFTQPAARQYATDFQISARALGDPDAPSELIAVTGFGTDETGTIINFAPEGGFKPFTEYQINMDRLVLGDLAESGFSWIFRTASSLADARQGGTIQNASGQVEIYFPPNALSAGTNEISIRRVAAAAGQLVQETDLTQITSGYAVNAAGALSKRATLTMSYTTKELGIADPAKLAIFRREDGGWLRLGGTSEPAGRLVLLAVDSLGTFAVFEDRSTLIGGLAVRELDCQPRAFSPRGEGLRGETDISFTLTGPADVTVRVYNAAGRLERVIVHDQAMAPGRVTLKWNGRDEDRNLVASGLYIVAVDAGGERAEKVVAVVQ